MRRPMYAVTLHNDAGELLSSSTRYAMNAGIRESERLVREYAREVGGMYAGDPATREGDTHSRAWLPYGTRWTGREGVELVATVERVA